jgi:hypothetical protein
VQGRGGNLAEIVVGQRQLQFEGSEEAGMAIQRRRLLSLFKLNAKLKIGTLTMIINIIIISRVILLHSLNAKNLVSGPQADQKRILIYEGMDMVRILRIRPDR